MRKINIREALLKIDKDSFCRYDLTSLYESCKLNDEDKVQLVKYIDAYEHPSIIGGFLESKCKGVNESYGDDDVSDIKGAEDIIKQINDNEVPLFIDCDIDDEEHPAVSSKPLTEDVIKSDKDEVRKYVWDKIQEFDSLTDDDSWYWTFDEDIRNGFAARLVSDEVDIPDNAQYKFSLPEVDLNFFLVDNSDISCYYVIDKGYEPPVTEGVSISKCPICGRQFAEGELDADNACPKCGEHLHKTDAGEYEKTDDDVDEALGDNRDVHSRTHMDNYDVYCTDCGQVTSHKFKGNFKDGEKELGRYICKECGCENDDDPINESIEEGVGTYAIVGWLSDHPQAYDDALSYFKTDDLDKVSEEDLINWIGEHDQLYDDYVRFFKLEEGLWDDIKSVGKTVGQVAKDRWDDSYTKAIATGLKKNFDNSRLGQDMKKIGDSVKQTDTYKNIKSKVDNAKQFVRDNKTDNNRKASDVSVEVRGKNYRASDLVYSVDGKKITPDEFARMNALKRGKVKISVPRGVKPVVKEDLNEGIDTSNLEPEIRNVLNAVMQENGYEADEIEAYTAVEIKDTVDDMIQVEVRAELGYDDLMELCDKLNPIVAAVDSHAYFEPVTSGIARAFIRNDQSDDIADEHLVAEWAERFNACTTKEELVAVYKDLMKVRENILTGGTLSAIYDVVDAKLDSLGESLTEDYNKGEWVEVNLNTKKNGTPNIIPVKVDSGHGKTFLGWAWGESQHEYPMSAIVKKIDMDDTDAIMRKYTPSGYMSEKLTLNENDDTDILYDMEDYDEDNTTVTAGNSFIEDGHTWTWFRQCGDTVHLDFDNWAVWWAYRPEVEDDYNSTAISGFFVVDTDTGFIDWGPCDTVKEAQEFLQSKVNDWENDDIDESISEESHNSVILKSELFYDNVDNCAPEELATFKKLGWIAGSAVVIPEGTKLTYHSSSNSNGAGYDYYHINSTEDLIGFSNQDPDLNDIFGEIDKEIIEESKPVKESYRQDTPDNVYKVGDRVAQRWTDEFNVGTVTDIKEEEGTQYKVEWDYSEGPSVEWLYGTDISLWIEEENIDESKSIKEDVNSAANSLFDLLKDYGAISVDKDMDVTRISFRNSEDDSDATLVHHCILSKGYKELTQYGNNPNVTEYMNEAGDTCVKLLIYDDSIAVELSAEDSSQYMESVDKDLTHCTECGKKLNDKGYCETEGCPNGTLKEDINITSEMIISKLLEIEGFEKAGGYRGSWSGVMSYKPGKGRDEGLVSVDIENNKVSVRGFAEGSGEWLLRTEINTTDELENLKTKVAEIQEQQLELYKSTNSL